MPTLLVSSHEVLFEERGQFIEWNDVHLVVKVGVRGARNDHQFLGLCCRRIGRLAEVARMGVFAVHEQDRPGRSLNPALGIKPQDPLSGRTRAK